MSLAWGLPLGFAALAALLVPLLLHLDRRRALRTLPFAAMRWLGDRHRPRRTWRLSEWLLLMLRLLLVACLALWLAQPLLRGWVAGERWLAVVPGVAASEIAAAAAEADRIVWLAPGFPAQDQPQPPAVGAIASLLRELDARLAADEGLRVLVPAELSGLDAAAIELSHRVDWRVVAGSQVLPDTVAASPRRHVLALRYADDADAAVPFLRAAVAAWGRSASFAVEFDEGPQDRALPARADALIWLGDAPTPAALALAEDGATLLRIPSHASGSAPATSADAQVVWPPSARRLGRGRQLQLDTPLDPQTLPELHSAGFPGMLHRVLFGDVPPPSRAHAGDVRPGHADASFLPREVPLRPWLGWIVAALFLLERVLANGPRLRGAG